MDQSECMVCPGKCRWQDHHSNSYRFETHEEGEERSRDFSKDYETSKSDAVRKTWQKVEDLQAKLYEMIHEAQEILARLDEIALKPNPLTELKYIDLLIESEQRECKPGYMKRCEYLQEARRHAEVIHLIADAPQWLKDAVQRAKQNVKKHFRSF